MVAYNCQIPGRDATLQLAAATNRIKMRMTKEETNDMPDSQQTTNQSFYDRISQAYDMIADGNEHKAREAGEKALQLQPGERALEVGFGTGNSLINLAQAVGANGEVCGIDVSPGMLSVAQGKLADKGLSDRVHLTVGNARSLPYEQSSFDAAFMSFTLELFALEDIPTVLAEILRVLKPGGRFAVVSMATVRKGEHASILEKTYVWMHQHFPHIVDCQPIDASQFLRDAGFDVRQEWEMDIWTMPVRGVVGFTPA